VHMDSNRLRLSREIPDLRTEQKISDACLSILIFSRVCVVQ